MISSLAPRNRSNYLDKCPNLSLSTNLFQVDFREDIKIYIYSVKITPDISHEDVKRLRNILIHSRKIIERLVGTFAISGRTLFGSKCLSGKDELNLKTEFEGTPYQIFLKMVKQVALSDIHSQDKRKSGVVFAFLNNMVKNFFYELDYTEIGRSRKYFDSQHYHQLEAARVLVYKGYSSNFTLLEGGLFLRIGPSFKIVRSQTALEVINRIYSCSSALSKQEKRYAVERELVGKMVMANYGKNVYHVIESVLFDTLIDGYTFNNGSQSVSLIQYYKDTYGITLGNKRQPLIRAEVDKKAKEKGKEVILIPQLLLMSGLPDDFDQRKRREVSEQTIVQPSNKFSEIEDIFKRFNDDRESFNPNTVSEKLGIKMESKPAKMQGKQLPIPELQLGKRDRVEEHKSTNFMLFNKNLYNSQVPLQIAMICPADYDLTQVKDLMRSTCSNLGLNYNLAPCPIKFQDPKTTLKVIENIVERECENSKENRNMFWFILPNNYKSHYGLIKKVVLRAGIQKNSQVCLTSTLMKKGFNSILTKILLQMAAKVGNKLWVPRVSAKLAGSGLVLIGIESYADSLNRNSNVLSYCCNTNKEFSSFYSNYLLTPKGGDKTHLNEIILNCLSEYLRNNKTPPHELIIIKNGSTKYQNKLLIDTEVNEVKQTLESAINSKVNLVYILLDKQTNQKFFSQRGSDVNNPQSGMLVNSGAVGKGFQFYLVAQQCNRGTVRPTFYKVVYSDTALEEGVIEELMYSQCFNYMNWTGSIKVPSVLQYAKKLSMFVGQYLNDKCVGESLNRYLYYI